MPVIGTILSTEATTPSEECSAVEEESDSNDATSPDDGSLSGSTSSGDDEVSSLDASDTAEAGNDEPDVEQHCAATSTQGNQEASSIRRELQYSQKVRLYVHTYCLHAIPGTESIHV